jgi:hypothetical protein
MQEAGLQSKDRSPASRFQADRHVIAEVAEFWREGYVPPLQRATYLAPGAAAPGYERGGTALAMSYVPRRQQTVPRCGGTTGLLFFEFLKSFFFIIEH